MKNGHLVSREGWNGKGLFVFMQVPSEVPAAIVPKMSSLPPAVKSLLHERSVPIRYSNQFAIIQPDSTINGWTPSPSDAAAVDWCIHPIPEGLDFTVAPVAETAGTATPLPPVPDDGLPDWKRRVLNEHADLSDKVEKLHAFLSNGNDHELPEAELDRLCQQRDLMRQYRGVLEARINAFAA